MVLFILPSTGSCSSSPNRLDRSGSCSFRGNTAGSCSSTPTGNCSSKPPSNAHYSSRGSIDRLQLAEVAKESLDRVQLTAIDRSGSVTRSLQCNRSCSVRAQRLSRDQLEPNASHPRACVYKRNAHRSAPTTHRNRELPKIFLALASTMVFSSWTTQRMSCNCVSSPPRTKSPFSVMIFCHRSRIPPHL